MDKEVLTIKERIANLIKVKTILTLLFSIAFIATVFLGKENQELAEIVRTIVIFFFGTQINKKE